MPASSVFRRFYRARPLSAALLCLPGLLLCLWYGWSAFARFDRYRRATGDEVPLTLEDLHIQLFDILRRDLRRISMPPAPESTAVQHLSLHISSKNFQALVRGAEREAQRPYVSARLERDRTLQPLELRLRGQRHWHVMPRQKSLKVRLPVGSLLFGNRIFNLVNDPSPMVVGDQIMLDVLKERGVLTPLAFFVRLALNGADLGVFHYESQPEESLLRLNRRMPGSMYSGNLPPSARTEELWNVASRWKKVATGVDARGKKRADLKRFLAKINRATVSEFVDFARHEMDQRAFATFDAVDVAFAGDQHNYRENHKLYFDPYRGRWEPIAWNLGGFRDDRVFNLVENPILLRLKLIPGFVSLRNRILYDLLLGDCSVSSIRTRATDMLHELAPELKSDRYWDAYRLLPRIGGFYRRMLRPMDLRRAVLVLESELTTYEGRHAFLVRELEKNPLWIAVGASRAEQRVPIQLVVDGRAGVSLRRFRARFSPSCEGVQWRVLRDDRPITPWSTDGQADVTQALDLFPAIGLIEREDASRSRGKVRTQMVPAAYPFVVTSSCVPETVEAEGVHLATGSRVTSRPADAELLKRIPQKTLTPDDVPGLQPGEVSAHPWSLSPPGASSVQLGPGTVQVPQTRIFGEHERVSVAAGTRLQMGPRASLVFLGQVAFEGTRQQPIVVEGSASRAWGGIALQGPGTAGSRFRHVKVTGGTKPRWRLVPYPGMLNFHDTQDITVQNCHFGHNRKSDDVVHVTYVKNLLVEDSKVKLARSDAWDLEFTEGVLRRVEVIGAGDDGLDLMASDVEVLDSVVIGCKGNGISCGEETAAVVRNTLVADAKVGALAKNASRLNLYGSLLFRNLTGIEVYTRTVRYEGDSRVKADVLFVVDSKRPIHRADLGRDRLDVGRIQTSLPRAGALAHLLQDVLGLTNWDTLPDWLKRSPRGGLE